MTEKLQIVSERIFSPQFSQCIGQKLYRENLAGPFGSSGVFPVALGEDLARGVVAVDVGQLLVQGFALVQPLDGELAQAVADDTAHKNRPGRVCYSDLGALWAMDLDEEPLPIIGSSQDRSAFLDGAILQILGNRGKGDGIEASNFLPAFHWGIR